MTNWQFTPVAWLYALAALICFAITWRGFTLRQIRGARLFAGMTFSAGIWTIAYLLGFFHRDLAFKLAMLRLEYLGAICTVTIWPFFAAVYSRTEGWIGRRAVAWIVVVPIATLVQIALVDRHDFFYRSFELTEQAGLVISQKVYGPGFYVWIAFSYSMVLAGAMFLLRGLIYLPSLLRQQVIPVTATAVVAVLPNFLYVAGLNPLAPYDPTCLSFSLVGVILAVAMGRYRFLDLVPVAHDLVIEHARIGVVVVDEQRRVLEVNPAACDLLATAPGALLGQPLAAVLPEPGGPFESGSEHRAELVLGRGRTVEVQSTPILTRRGIPDGRIVMLYDISDRKFAEEELRRQATTDPLTETFNRRQFFVLAEQCRRQARRHGRPVTLAMIDLDHFKEVNDRFGHALGDEVLREVAEQLEGGLREQDVLVRYGGEEFIVLMPDTDLPQSLEVVERIRRQVEVTPLAAPAQEIRITISAGLSQLDPGEDRAVERLVDRADRALYRAKNEGRNRIAVEKPVGAGA